MKRNLVDKFLFYTVLALGVIICQSKAFAGFYEVDGGIYSIISSVDATVSLMEISESFTGSTFVVPEEVVFDDPKFQGYGPFKVIGIGGLGKKNTYVTTIEIPACIIYFNTDPLYIPPNLQNIIVSENNKYYASKDGILYNKYLTELLLCPKGREGKIMVQEGIEIISKYAFRESKVEEVILPSSLTGIEEYAFSGSEIQKIILPQSLKSIGNYAFWDSNLEEIVIPNSVTYLGKLALASCENLKSVQLSNGIDTIGSSTFSGTSLETVDIPNSVRVIQTQAFSRIKTLRTVSIPEATEKIGMGLFSECENLTDIYVSDKNPYFTSEGSTLFSKDKTILYSILPSGSRVCIPDGVEQIISEAISILNGVEVAVFPQSLKRIDREVLNYCYDLKRVYFFSENPPEISVDNFKDGYSHPLYIDFYVPAQSVELYRNMPQMEYWKVSVYPFDAAGVEEIETEKDKPDLYTVYTTDGRLVLETGDADRLNTLPKGIYIINGRKVVK